VTSIWIAAFLRDKVYSIKKPRRLMAFTTQMII